MNLSCDVLQGNLHNLSSRDQSFAKSLIEAGYSKRGLSEKQQEWVNILLKRAEGKAAPQQPQEREKVALPEFAKMIEIFDAAKATIATPKITVSNADGETLIVRLAGEASRNPGTLDVLSPGVYGERKWYGRILRDGNFEKSPRETMSTSLLALLQNFSANPAGVAAEYGKRTGVCCFCNRKLTDKRSIGVGYGPICANRFALPWG